MQIHQNNYPTTQSNNIQQTWCQCDLLHLPSCQGEWKQEHTIHQWHNEAGTSATTLVSVWNTRVFRTALTALAEPRTLWRRIRRDGSCGIPPLRHLLYHASYSCNASHCILRLPLRRQASFTLRPECGGVYPPSERHVCYTLRRGCSYAVAVYTTPGDVYAFLRPIATWRTLIYV